MEYILKNATIQTENLEGIGEIYKSNKQSFIFGDNIDYLRWCKSQMMFKYFHIGIVDPPYGINAGKMKMGAKSTKAHNERGYVTGDWDTCIPTQEYWDLLWYCCRDLIVWGGNYFVGNLGKVSDNSGKVVGIPNGRCFIVWDKKKYDLDFADGELALTTIDSNAIIISRARNAAKDEFDGEKRHQTQKPVYLYDRIYQDFIKKDFRVLDTHGGSFTHSVAAFRNNISLTIMDKEKSYFLSGIDNYILCTQKPRLLF